MGNNLQQHPLFNLPKKELENLRKIIPKRDWWTLWYFIFNGKLVEFSKLNKN
jgi:hypothetical protein